MQLACVKPVYLDCDHPRASVLEEVLAVDAHDVAGLPRVVERVGHEERRLDVPCGVLQQQ